MKTIRKNIDQFEKNDIIEIGRIIDKNCGLVFHEIEFNKIVSDVFNTELSYFLAFNVSNQIIGCCSMHTIKKGFLKLTYSNPAIYEVPYGGWVFDDTQVKVKDLLRNTRISSIESLTYWSNIQIVDDVYNNLVFKTSPRQSAVIDLSMDEDLIWEKIINPKKKNKIRKAIKSGICIKVKGIEGLESYYELLKDMSEGSGLKPKPRIYYEKILRFYSKNNQAKILLAEKDKKIISGVVLIGNTNVMHYWQGASKTGIPNLGQGELLQWEAIKWSKKSKSDYYDLCVIEKERLPGIAAFKTGFTKQIVVYYYLTKRSLNYRILSKISNYFKFK